MSKVNGIFSDVRRVFNKTNLDSLILFVTNACNLRCWFCCYADNLNQTKDIPFEDLLKLSATMPKFRALLLSGGEPFIRPKLDEIMLAFARNNGIKSIYIPTNGWYLDRTEAMCRSFLEQEREVMLTLCFSEDGLEATHDQIRTKGTKGSFAALCKTIEHLSPWREKYPNLRLRVNTVVTPDIMGKLWPFACTAGRQILVVSGSGSLRACEHRGEIVDLREHGFDFAKAMATGLMAKEVAQIAKDRCDCIHGCFVGNSLQHAPKTIITRGLPKVMHKLTKHPAKN